MSKVLYIGFVLDTANGCKKVASVSKSKQTAGDLMEKWLEEYDPQNVDYIGGGVWSFNDADYIDVEGDRNDAST